jgi:Skp family chaperone for outer membrane proteins
MAGDAEDIKAALARQRKAALLAKCPSWLDRKSCALSESGNAVTLTFHCPCKTKKVQQALYLGQGMKRLTSETAIAVRLAEKMQEAHGHHNNTREAPDPQGQLQQLKHTVSSQKRKLTMMQTDLAAAERKVAKAADAVKNQTERKRQETRAESRRIDIDPAKKEPLSAADLSTAKLSKASGILDTVKYWAQGSAVAVLQLVMMLIKSFGPAFGLESQVAAELGAELDQTNQYIVDRARASLTVLKQCRTEEQRQHYRVVLTALAPDNDRRSC